jgi:hypothetical protein
MPDTSPPAAAPAAGGGLAASLKSKFGPMPVWVWLALITALLLGYWLLTKNKSGSSSGSPGTSGTPADVGQPGVVVINEDTGGGTPGGQAPPPPTSPPPTGPPTEPHSRQITVDQDETLAQLAKQRHWTSGTLRQVEAENVKAGQGKLTPKSKLKKGQTIIRPLRG